MSCKRGCPSNQFCGACLPECERCTESLEIFLIVWEVYNQPHPQISATFTYHNAKDMLTTLANGMVHLHGGDDMVDVEYLDKEEYADVPRTVWVGTYDGFRLAGGKIMRKLVEGKRE